MTPIQAQRIANAVSVLRPEWAAASIETLLLDPAKHLSRRPACDVAAALAWVACDPASKTPGRVLEHGPWWPTRPESEPARTAQCPRCRDFHPPTERHECVRPSSRKADHIAEMREAVAAARGNHQEDE